MCFSCRARAASVALGMMQGSPFPVYFSAPEPKPEPVAVASPVATAALTPAQLAQKAMANLQASGLGLGANPLLAMGGMGAMG